MPWLPMATMPCVLGLALAERQARAGQLSTRHTACGRVLQIGARIRDQQRDGASTRGRSADRPGVRNRLPFHPVFFLQDDHDHFENDDATDEIVTFPPTAFMLRLARATQQLYYPEFLPDAARPGGLPWAGSGDRDRGLSESFGTLRYGRLAEVLLYDVRRTMTLAGPSAVFVDPEVERWLRDRTASTDTTHLVHAPSNPPGWSAGKWGEWYPDILGADGKLTTKVPNRTGKRAGWPKHDRLRTVSHHAAASTWLSTDGSARPGLPARRCRGLLRAWFP